MTSSPLISRIISVAASLLVLGFAYGFIQIALAPVQVEPPPPAKAAVQFDPKVDISKNAAFLNLRPLAAPVVEPELVGRLNPFTPPTQTTSTP